MGFKEETLDTELSKEKWTRWKDNNCQPNFWLVMKQLFACVKSRLWKTFVWLGRRARPHHKLWAL